MTFAALSAALLAFLLLMGVHPARPTPARSSVPPPTAAPTRARAAREPTFFDGQAQIRGFLLAFLAFEVGSGDPKTKALIRGHASRAFARQLLSDPAIPRGPRPGPARITSLHVDHVPGHRDLVLVSGDARRREGAEPFSFIFGRRAGRWSALAPGE